LFDWLRKKDKENLGDFYYPYYIESGPNGVKVEAPTQAECMAMYLIITGSMKAKVVYPIDSGLV
jgi:hypothetical protein